MTGIQIKIGGKWAYLPDDFSLSLEQTSPVFNDQGTFSFPFEIPLEPNREIFQNIADPYGDISLKDIDKLPAEIWFMGVMLYRGKIETDSEIEFEESVPLTFISGNSDFMDRIEEINARDVPLDQQIKLGYLVSEAESEKVRNKVNLPDYVMMNYTEYNVSEPYPIKTYCNVRVCTSNADGYYKVLDAKRPYSGVCFYVMYFIDCLFKYLNLTVKRNDMGEVEDMNRLAFFTTQCHVTQSEDRREIPLSEIMRKDFLGPNFQLKLWSRSARPGVADTEISTNEFKYYAYDLYATNENFPDVSAKDIIEDLKNAFGIKFIFDSYTNEISVIYIKDVLEDKEEEILTPEEILDFSLKREKIQGERLTYGEDNDDAFNYDDYNLTKQYDNYQEILNDGISSFDRYCKIDKTTGNAYRVKVNKQTGGDPSLFEVGGFRDYIYPKDADSPEDITINFKPIITNYVSAELLVDGGITNNVNSRSDFSSRSNTRPSTTMERPGNTNPLDTKSRLEAVFVDVELENGTEIDKNISEGYAYFRRESTEGYLMNYIYLRALCSELFDTESNDESPLRSYDAGYSLGIMRGPGNESSIEISDTNYDGEGNGTWIQTVGSYAFTSDSCDCYGRMYDYNGLEEGGADQSGRFSLKLTAEKDGYSIDGEYSKRGLVSKFLSEYIYFKENRKTIILSVRLSTTQIIGINFLKKYRIGQFIGFINKISYTLGVNGLTDVTIELYTI